MRHLLPLIICTALAVAACTSSTTEVSADDPGSVTPGSESVDSSATDSTAGESDADDSGTGDSGTGEPDASDPDEGGFDDPSAGPDRGSDEPRQVPPLDLPATAPGSNEAAAELLEELERFVTADHLAAGVPWPDLRNPDPVAAYQAAAAFQNWMSENNPTPTLVEAYTAPRSPERGFDLELFQFRNNFDLRSAPGTPPYSMQVEDLVHPAATGITDALLAQVPEGSAAVVYWDSVGPTDLFTAEGQYFDTSPGWTNVGPWVAIMAPTDVGWQVWWDELTEPPPPGSREQRGTPQPDDSRRDV